MVRKLTSSDIAFAYELHQEYNWSYRKIAKFIGCNKGNLITYIKRFEKEGVLWR